MELLFKGNDSDEVTQQRKKFSTHHSLTWVVLVYNGYRSSFTTKEDNMIAFQIEFGGTLVIRMSGGTKRDLELQRDLVVEAMGRYEDAEPEVISQMQFFLNEILFNIDHSEN